MYSYKVPEPGTSKCHVLPFKIDFEGKIENKLQPEAPEKTDERWHANFRGRPLQGKEIDLKDHIVVELRQQEEDSDRYTGIQSLEKYILYEHAADPEPNDPYGDRLHDLLEMATSII